MMGTRNPNHRNSVKKPITVEDIAEDVVETIVEPAVEEVVEEDGKEDIVLEENEVTKEYLYSLNKAEQINLLIEIGFDDEEIKKLKKEKDRVDTLFDHVGVN